MDAQEKRERLDEIYRREVDTVYRVCWLYMKNTADAEDAVSETFVKLMRSGTEFESFEHEKAWLIAAARNVCRDVLKSPKYKNEPLDENMLTGEILTDETLAAVKELPEKYRTAVYLYYYEGYSCGEIAEMLGTVKSTVISRLARGRKILKKIIGGDLDGTEKSIVAN
ncbi:MAG: sigma-70 family RNA polymerase sigma factor [Ruminococcus sp.]|nr:sigma-70 family RNA polymerase sigma factor [Ruminococcus sp.]MCM1380480.1 sigma-70 family RNA polymerase sigma factor [Muribaculaceae bacterium]MCM1478120.1 sigma-70 family RNA polymerase sigma factor [Muribaculaceae bacterium]